MTENQDWRIRYNEVIASFRWKALRLRLFNERCWTCEKCKTKTKNLELHHKTYERLGEELDGDLAALCARCHAEADAERAHTGRMKSNRALTNARIDGLASRRYGDDWQERGDAEEIQEKLERWMEDRE